MRIAMIVIFALFGGFAAVKAVSLGADPWYFIGLVLILGVATLLRWGAKSGGVPWFFEER